MQSILDTKRMMEEGGSRLKVIPKILRFSWLTYIWFICKEKEDGGDNYSFSNSPKKEHEKLPGRKESDYSYGQGRKNSFLSNFGGHGQFN